MKIILRPKISQVKYVFQFDIDELPHNNVDVDNGGLGDGLPDGWELKVINSDPNDGLVYLDDVQAAGDDDLDTIDNLTEFNNGTGPLDPFNGKQPNLQVIFGDGQEQLPDVFLPYAFDVIVVDDSGEAIPYVPVTFSTEGGHLGLSPETDGTPAPVATITYRTDERGIVSAPNSTVFLKNAYFNWFVAC